MPSRSFIQTTNGTTLTEKVLFTALTATGTVAVTEDSDKVTGTTTKFTEQLQRGDTIIINSETHKVRTVISDTVLLIDDKIATTATGETLTYYPKQIKDINQKRFTVHNLDDTNPVYIGYSLKGDGTDLMATNGTPASGDLVELIATGDTKEFIGQDLTNWYTIAVGTSQVFSITTK